jgi:hypothetical protein
VGFTESDQGIGGKTSLRELLMGKIGLREHKRLETTPTLKLRAFLDIKHLHNALVTDATSFCSGK